MATIVATFTTIAGLLLHEERGGTESSYTPDPIGNLIECRNSLGTQLFSAEYWPYGELQTTTGSNPTPWAFIGLHGYMADSAVLLYVRARYLMAKWARWLTSDPLWPQQSPFLYVGGMPTVFVDPQGTDILDFLWGLLNPPDIIHKEPGPPAPWNAPPGTTVNPSPAMKCMMGIGQVKNFNYLTWEWGNCCGLNKKCGPGKSNGSCADNACEKHDKCVGSTWPGKDKWKSCAAGLCKDLQNCYAKLNCKSQVTRSSECQAAFEAGVFFCAQAGKAFIHG